MENKYPNLLCFLENKTKGMQNNVALSMNTIVGWKELTFGGIGILSKHLASYLMEKGIEKGDRISIISESNPEWAAVLFASILSGSVLVPIDIKLTIHEMKSILSNCMPKVLLVSNKFIKFAKILKEEISSIQEILVINETSSEREFRSIHDLDLYKDKKWRHRGLNKTALIIYTSGTTGNPKGVEITYKNMLSQVYGISRCFPLKKHEKLLSILPMNHLFELSVGFLTFLNLGTTIYYPQNLKPENLFYILKEKQISFMVVVPAFLKLIKTDIESDIHKKSSIGKFWFNVKYALAKFVPSYHVRRWMFRKISKKLGGKFKGCISGGAPLDLNVGEFINRIGIRVFEGYGLSEASPVVSMSTQKHNKLGYVGRAIPGVNIKIDEETGELLVSGDNIMKGYYGQPELTATVVEKDGWLHTGDIAEIDKQGYLKITGRIKNMIVLSGGKKVFPEEVESVLDKSSYIKESCVVGTVRKGGQKDGTECVTAVVVPNFENVPEGNDADIFIKKQVSELSQMLAPYKRPTKVIVAKENLPRTATSKIKRKEVKELYVTD
ncbi:AMP-binding protein [bacterium]|nr:AMP-binding protein [bacterium]